VLARDFFRFSAPRGGAIGVLHLSVRAGVLVELLRVGRRGDDGRGGERQKDADQAHDIVLGTGILTLAGFISSVNYDRDRAAANLPP
jgi:hypothetical protein